MNIVFMGTSSFAVLVLEELLKMEDSNILGVVTTPDRPAGRGRKLHPPPVKEKAEKEGVGYLATKAGECPGIRKCPAPCFSGNHSSGCLWADFAPGSVGYPPVGSGECPRFSSSFLPRSRPHSVGPSAGRKGDRGYHYAHG